MQEVIGVYIVGCILAIVIGGYILRWAIRSDSIIKNQQATLWFLIKLCEKQGVTPEEIEKIKMHFNLK